MTTIGTGVPGGTGDFASWYRAEHPRVLAVLCAVSGDPELARDATDEAFARCYSRWEKVREMGSPSGWTYRVALNVVRRARRRQAMERRLLFRRPAPPDTCAPPDPTWMDVARALSVLSDRQRAAVVLRYVADLPEADIATALAVQRGTVASMLSVARRRLAAHLEPDGTTRNDREQPERPEREEPAGA